MKSGLYIMTHKEIKNKFPSDRKIMLVGAKGKSVPEKYYSDYDSEKDNISEKNKNFCELTGLYYMVKNDDSDILSLEHYRRLFIRDKYFVFRYPFLKEKHIYKILKNYDIIVPKKLLLINETVFESYSKLHYTSDMEKIAGIITTKYPKYKKSFDEVMSGHETYICNMFIGKKEIVKNYANWLFDILFELEKQIDISKRDDYQKRVFGFLAERMLTVYLKANTNIKVKEFKIEMVEKSAFKTFLDKVKNKLKRR